MDSKKQSQPILNGAYKDLSKLGQGVRTVNKNAVGSLHHPKDAALQAKEVTYVNLYANKKIHFGYWIVILVLGFGFFSYFDKHRITEIRTETRIVYQNAPVEPAPTRSVSALSESAFTRPAEYNYKSSYYDDQAVRLKIDREIEKLRSDEWARYSQERDAYRASRGRGYSSGWEEKELGFKHDRNRVRILAEKDRKLCEELNEKFNCANWENFQKNIEKF